MPRSEETRHPVPHCRLSLRQPFKAPRSSQRSPPGAAAFPPCVCACVPRTGLTGMASCTTPCRASQCVSATKQNVVGAIGVGKRRPRARSAETRRAPFWCSGKQHAVRLGMATVRFRARLHHQVARRSSLQVLPSVVLALEIREPTNSAAADRAVHGVRVVPVLLIFGSKKHRRCSVVNNMCGGASPVPRAARRTGTWVHVQELFGEETASVQMRSATVTCGHSVA
jgi:hypothetical protein